MTFSEKDCAGAEVVPRANPESVYLHDLLEIIVNRVIYVDVLEGAVDQLYLEICPAG